MHKALNVRISGSLLDFVKRQISPHGMYENASEYIRDLVRRDHELRERRKWTGLIQNLTPGALADASEFTPLDMDSILKESKKQKARK